MSTMKYIVLSKEENPKTAKYSTHRGSACPNATNGKNISYLTHIVKE